MATMKFDANEKRSKFCQELAPTEVHPSQRSTTVHLKEHEFASKVKSFYSTTIPRERTEPPLHKASGLFDEPFIIGESHTHISPKRFLIENFQKMKEQGYEILFMEHLFYDAQEDLDKFFETGEITPKLKQQLRDMNQHGMQHGFSSNSSISEPLWKEHDYTAVLHAARKEGIRIVGIDISAVYKSQQIGMDSQQLDNTRIPYMNYTATKIMQHEIESLPPGKKWCAFMGNAHLSTYEGTPGVTDLLGVRSVYIFDQEDWLSSKTPQKGVIECDSEAVILGGRDLFRGDAVFRLDPKAGTKSLVSSHPTASFRESLESMRSSEPLSGVKEKLAIDYLSSLDIDDLCKQFGFNEKERKALSTYHVVEKLSPVNPRKTKEENNTFSFQIEGNYSSDKPYTLYVSKDQLLAFASRQLKIEQQKEQERTFSPYEQ